MPAPPAPTRILVKVHPALAQNLEPGLAETTAEIVPGQDQAGPASHFLARYSPRKLSALYPGLISLRRAHGWSDAQIADQIRQRFPRRTAHNPHPIAIPEVSRTYVLEPADTSPASLTALLARLKADPEVEFAEAEHAATTCYAPNDPYFNSSGSWGQLFPDLWGLFAINGPAAWDSSQGAGILVAVIDTGIDSTHPDIAANYDPGGWDFVGATINSPVQGPNPVDRFGHGTHVAGTIAAVGNNSLGIIGVAPQAKVMDVKALDDAGNGNDSTLCPAIVYAANNGANVINASWTGEGWNQALEEAIQFASNVGVVFVAAAGNSAADATAFFPANSPEAITVAATGYGGQFAAFSNFGVKIDVTAPGVDILSLRATGTTMGTPVGGVYTRANGTSMAAPHVSGLVALLLARDKTIPVETIRQEIRTSAAQVGGAWNAQFGYGILDARAALAMTGALQAHLTSPVSGLVLTGAVQVTGLAQGAGFDHYVLDYGLGSAPTTWTQLQTSRTPVAGGALGTFDAGLVPDGLYTIRLTVYDASGHAFSDRVALSAASIRITSPACPPFPNAAMEFKPGTVLPILGSATGNTFRGFRIQWAAGINPGTGWSSAGVQLTGAGAAPITGGTLGTWDTTGITTAGYYTVRVQVDDQDFTNQALTLVYLEPSLVSQNWPKNLVAAPYLQSGLIPAQDATGKTVLVLAEAFSSSLSASAGLVRFSPDGASQSTSPLSPLTYFSPTVGPLDASAGQDIVVPNPAGGVTALHADGSSTVFQPAAGLGSLTFGDSQILLANLTTGPELDVVAFAEVPEWGGTGYLFAWHPDGSLLGPRFPVIIPSLDTLFTQIQSTAPRVLVGDIDGDGLQDFVVSEGLSGSSYTLARFRQDGTPVPWLVPVFNEVPGTWGITELALADLDHNGKLETLMIAGGNLHVFQPDGSERNGWPQSLAGAGVGHLAVGDLDLDGSDEIVVSASGFLYVFKADGTAFSSAWPQGPGSNWMFLYDGHPVLADVDGDGYPEILCSEGNLYSQTGSVFGTATPADSGPMGPDIQILASASAGAGHPTPPARTQAGTATYITSTLVAMHRDGTVARSWELMGTGGNPPEGQPVITVGDFEQTGQAEIALTYYNLHGGMLVSGTATLLATGTAFHAGASPWPMIYHDSAHTARLAGLVLYPVTLPAAAPGTPYTVQLTAAGGKAPYTFSVGSGSLPPGLVLTTAGLLHGTATSGGTYTFRIAVRDQANATRGFSYAMVVACPVITVSPATLPTAGVGSAYSGLFSATGGTAPYTFTLASGGLPPGLTLASSGLLSGTCSASGTYPFHITAADPNGCTGTQACTLTVDCPAISLLPATLPSPMVGSPYSCPLAGTGGTGPYSFMVTSGSLPPGLTLTTAGLLSGTCTTSGSATFQIAVRDQHGCTGVSGCTLQTRSPVVQVSTAQAGLLTGASATYSASAIGSADPSVVWTASGGNPVPAGNTIHFSADAPGTYTLIATAAVDALASASITVQVHGANFSNPAGPVTGLDALTLIGALGSATPSLDLDGQGLVDAADLDLLLNALGW